MLSIIGIIAIAFIVSSILIASAVRYYSDMNKLKILEWRKRILEKFSDKDKIKYAYALLEFEIEHIKEKYNIRGFKIPPKIRRID